MTDPNISAAILGTMQAYAESVERERDAALSELAEVRAEARACFDAQSEIDEAWNAIGTRGNRASLSLSEQIESICRELDDGSFYKESDIDALMAERDALRAEVEAERQGSALLLDTLRIALRRYELTGDAAQLTAAYAFLTSTEKPHD